jgi:hypothetical protein
VSEYCHPEQYLDPDSILTDYHDRPLALMAVSDEERPIQRGPFSPHSIQLPKGGNVSGGIGEGFVANPATGTGSLTIPMTTSPGHSGFVP